MTLGRVFWVDLGTFLTVMHHGDLKRTASKVPFWVCEIHRDIMKNPFSLAKLGYLPGYMKMLN